MKEKSGLWSGGDGLQRLAYRKKAAIKSNDRYGDTVLSVLCPDDDLKMQSVFSNL